MKHTPEPWGENTFHQFPSKARPLGEVDYDRAKACVNALADIDDPAAFVTKAKKAMELCEKFAILNEAHYKDIAGFILEARRISTEEQK